MQETPPGARRVCINRCSAENGNEIASSSKAFAMALLTGHAGTADLIEEEYFTCESGEDSVVVHMHLDAVDGIARDVVEGLTSSRRGIEAGGLLLGHAEPGDRPRVWIDRYQRLACEHRLGPRFSLDAKDIEELEKAAAAIHQSSELNIVGFYRSHPHPGFQLEEADHELIARYFSDPGDLILLIRPESAASISAQFFARNAAGEVRPSGGEFPFHGRVVGALDGSLAEEPAPQPDADAVPCVPEGPPATPDRANLREGFRRLVPDFVPVEEQGRPSRAFMNESTLPAPQRPDRSTPLAHTDELERSSTGSFFRRWWPLGGAIVLVGGAFWLLLPNVGRREATPVTAVASSETGVAVRPLGLYVDTSGAAWRISWNRDATALNGARAVALFVRDGDDQNRVDLSPQDLASGSYQYKPGGQDITFRLEVTDNSGHLTAESFRLMNSATAVAVERPKPAAPATNIVRPVPRIKVPPTVPASIRPRIKDPIPIDVWVQVDVHGRVADAVPATKQHPGLEAYLATRAVAAAKQWRFDPAREDGKPVLGRERIHFLFER
jgi:proteasome lid subunit RPN8/RPN11